MLDAMDARTLVIASLLVPIVLVALLRFFAPNVFRKVWIPVVAVVVLLEAFMIYSTAPLFL